MSEFKDIIEHPLGLLSFCGCFGLDKYSLLSFQCRPRCLKYLAVYRFLLVFLHIANLARCSAFEIHFIQHFSNQMAFFIQWYLLLIYGSAVFFLESIIARIHLGTILEALKFYEENFGFRRDMRKLKLVVRCCTYVFIAVVAIGTVATNTVYMFWLEVEKPYFIFPFHDSRGLAYVLGGYCISLMTTVTYLPICGYFLLYSALIEICISEFCGAQEELRVLLCHGAWTDQTEMRILKIRERHKYLCGLVNNISYLTRFFTVACLTIGITVVFFVIYALASGQMSNTQVINEAFISSLNLVFILFVCVRWGHLPHEAAGITQPLRDITLHDKLSEVLLKVHIFYNECSLSKFGINLYGLCTLDSSLTVVVLGTIATYGLVVLQFQLQKDSPCVAWCANTSLVAV